MHSFSLSHCLDSIHFLLLSCLAQGALPAAVRGPHLRWMAGKAEGMDVRCAKL